MLRPGDTAPDFELTDDRNRKVRLSSLLREGPLILYFYPADFTPVCTREACMFRDVHEDLAARGVRVLGVSTQAPETHARFRQRHGLPFPLLADTDKSVARAYGALGFLGLALRRISYLIGKDGRILDVVRADLRLGRHQEFVGRVLETLRDEKPAS
jgi:peroxiredoxin Q/BCP